MSKYIASQRGEDKGPERRPHLASLVSDVAEALKWHYSVQKEIETDVTKIQNKGLAEDESAHPLLQPPRPV